MARLRPPRSGRNRRCGRLIRFVAMHHLMGSIADSSLSAARALLAEAVGIPSSMHVCAGLSSREPPGSLHTLSHCSAASALCTVCACHLLGACDPGAASLNWQRAAVQCAKQPDVALFDPCCPGPAASHVCSARPSSLDEALHTSRCPIRGSRRGLHPGTCSSPSTPRCATGRATQ